MGKPKAQLVITLTEDGQVQVQGPMRDPVLFFGLLESAKDVRRQWLNKQQAQSSKIARASLSDLPPGPKPA
jgi:hypothetical protein